MAMTLLATNEPSGAANSSFTSSIDSTYKLFIFKWVDVNPATDNVDFTVNFSDDTSSHSYDLTKTTNFFWSYHSEADATPVLAYRTANDLAQATGYQILQWESGGGENDEAGAGELYLFNPSNTTYVKHFYATSQYYQRESSSFVTRVGGYCNTTAAVTAVDFKMSSGNFDGIIRMYGVG